MKKFDMFLGLCAIVSLGCNEAATPACGNGLLEPGAKYAPGEIAALHDFVKNGGGLFLFADHSGADRDGNAVDAVIAINHMLENLPGAASKSDNPFGFFVLEISSMANDVTAPAPDAPAQIAQGVAATDSFAGTAFEIVDAAKVTPILITSKDNKNYAVAAQYGKGRIVAVGDSSIAGDGTNFLGIRLSKAGYYSKDNRKFLLNAMQWLRGLQ